MGRKLWVRMASVYIRKRRQGKHLPRQKEYKDAPTVIEFMIATDELVLPMVKSGNPMSEMILK